MPWRRAGGATARVRISASPPAQRARTKPPASSRKPNVPGMASNPPSPRRPTAPRLGRRQHGWRRGCGMSRRRLSITPERDAAAELPGPPAVRRRAAGPAWRQSPGPAAPGRRRHTAIDCTRCSSRRHPPRPGAGPLRPAPAASPSTQPARLARAGRRVATADHAIGLPGTPARPGGYPARPRRPARTAGATARNASATVTPTTGTERRAPALGQRQGAAQPGEASRPDRHGDGVETAPPWHQEASHHAGQAGRAARLSPPMRGQAGTACDQGGRARAERRIQSPAAAFRAGRTPRRTSAGASAGAALPRRHGRD